MGDATSAVPAAAQISGAIGRPSADAAYDEPAPSDAGATDDGKNAPMISVVVPRSVLPQYALPNTTRVAATSESGGHGGLEMYEVKCSTAGIREWPISSNMRQVHSARRTIREMLQMPSLA